MAPMHNCSRRKEGGAEPFKFLPNIRNSIPKNDFRCDYLWRHILLNTTQSILEHFSVRGCTVLTSENVYYSEESW
jgi:hypothetical protein